VTWEEACDVLASRYGLLPWEVWERFPLRHIQRYYQHAMRALWRDRYFRMRLEDPRIREPRWLHEDLDAKQARSRSSASDYERMKTWHREHGHEIQEEKLRCQAVM